MSLRWRVASLSTAATFLVVWTAVPTIWPGTWEFLLGLSFVLLAPCSLIVLVLQPFMMILEATIMLSVPVTPETMRFDYPLARALAVVLNAVPWAFAAWLQVVMLERLATRIRGRAGRADSGAAIDQSPTSTDCR